LVNSKRKKEKGPEGEVSYSLFSRNSEREEGKKKEKLGLDSPEKTGGRKEKGGGIIRPLSPPFTCPENHRKEEERIKFFTN